jgi:hypothetical protein
VSWQILRLHVKNGRLTDEEPFINVVAATISHGLCTFVIAVHRLSVRLSVHVHEVHEGYGLCTYMHTRMGSDWSEG